MDLKTSKNASNSENGEDSDMRKAKEVAAWRTISMRESHQHEMEAIHVKRRGIYM